MKVQNSVALVTGANRGIGHALVGALLAAGATKVYAAARNTAELATTVALDPKRVVAVKLDVTKPAEVAGLAETARDVTLLINNAGALEFGDALTVPLDALHRQFDVNFFGPLLTSRALAPAIEKNGGGAIVNVSTIVALASMPAIAGYNASKAALTSLTQSLRATLANRKVEVFTVFPGPIDTDMARPMQMDKTSPADAAKAIVAGINAGTEDIFPDAMSQSVYQNWKADHKAVEHQFGGM